MLLPSIRSFGTLLTLSLLLILSAPYIAMAQPSGARGDDFIYRVQRNDTLINLSNRFTGTANNWQTLQTLNTVSDPYALPIGLELRIPFALIPEVAAQAEVIHVTGRALLNQQPARLHDAIQEGDHLATTSNSYLTFELPDASISSLPANSTVRIERLRSFMGTGLVDVILKLNEGSLESTVSPDGRGTGRYEVQTPVSITGVRGTRLRVHTDNDGARTEVLSGSAQLGTGQADGPQLGARQGTAVTRDGTMLAPRPLLPAPVLSADTDAPHSRTLMFEPVPGAVAYQVRVAVDEAGTQPVWTQTVTQPPASYHTPGSGTWYVLLRAIDDVGLMGDDAVQPVEGRGVLISPSGASVLTGYGEPVMLTDY